MAARNHNRCCEITAPTSCGGTDNNMKRLRNKLARIDAHTLEVLNGAGLAFVLRGLGAGLAFALNVAIGRLLGAEGTGLYFLALSVTSIAAVIARLGLDNSLLRFIAAGAAQKDWGQVKGVFAIGMKLAGVVSLALSLVCLAIAPWLAESVFREPELARPLRWMSLGIFTFSMMTLLSEALKGLKRIPNSMLVSGVLYPLGALILIWPLASLMGPAGASLAYVLGTALAAGLGMLYWQRATQDEDAPAKSFSRETLWASSRPLWMTMIVNRAILPWLPLFLLGIWGTTAEVGVFGAATRIVMLVSFLLVAVNTAMAPKVAELYALGDTHSIRLIVKKFSLAITLASSPLFILLIVQGDFVMGLFGDAFTNGGEVLAILAWGQAVTICSIL